MAGRGIQPDSPRSWPHRPNYNSTKVSFAYLGFSPGEAPDKNESMSSFLPAALELSNPKLLDQIRHFMRLRHYSLRSEEV
jgi:hypothetical protein